MSKSQSKKDFIEFPGTTSENIKVNSLNWVGLTNDEIDDLWKAEYFHIHYELPRAIEAKTKGKKYMKVMMIDPPAGWKYGFPKPMPKKFDTWEETQSWLISEGYPQSEIDACGNYFHCRYWEEEIDDAT